MLELQRLYLGPGRVVNFRDQLGAGIRRADLRLVGQFLQRIVVPEFDLDTTVQTAPLVGVVRAEWSLGATTIAFDRRCR